MPVVRVGNKVFALLIEESRKLELSTRALADYIILQYFGELEEEDEEDEEEEDGEDGEGPDILEILGLDSEEDEEEEE